MKRRGGQKLPSKISNTFPCLPSRERAPFQQARVYTAWGIPVSVWACAVVSAKCLLLNAIVFQVQMTLGGMCHHGTCPWKIHAVKLHWRSLTSCSWAWRKSEGLGQKTTCLSHHGKARLGWGSSLLPNVTLLTDLHQTVCVCLALTDKICGHLLQMSLHCCLVHEWDLSSSMQWVKPQLLHLPYHPEAASSKLLAAQRSGTISNWCRGKREMLVKYLAVVFRLLKAQIHALWSTNQITQIPCRSILVVPSNRLLQLGEAVDVCCHWNKDLWAERAHLAPNRLRPLPTHSFLCPI